jgi:hypothetical protein
LQTIALSTEAVFSKTFDKNDIKDYLCRKDGKKEMADEEYTRRTEEGISAL